jgi:hypothetical protein
MELGANVTPQLPLPSAQSPEIHRESTPATVTTLLRWQVPAVVQASPHLEPAVRLCERMAAQVDERGSVGAAGKAHHKSWVLAMEALLRIDGHSPDDVRRVLDWLDRGADDVADFWRGNVLCPAKLRIRWGQMQIQYHAQRRRQMGGRRQGLAEAAGVDGIMADALARHGGAG